MDMSLENYITLIQQWAVERNIIKRVGMPETPGLEYNTFSGGTLIGQARKLLEEASEVLEAAAIAEATDDWDAYQEKLRDGLGDTFVVLCVIAAGVGVDLKTDCVAHAWEQIKDRKGQMINGKFVKEPSEDSVAYALAASEGYSKDVAERKTATAVEQAAPETTSRE